LLVLRSLVPVVPRLLLLRVLLLNVYVHGGDTGERRNAHGMRGGACQITSHRIVACRHLGGTGSGRGSLVSNGVSGWIASLGIILQIGGSQHTSSGRWESRPTKVTRSRHAAYHVFEPQRSRIGQRGVCCSGATAANGSKKRGGNGSKSERT
jgi:hypothetical protein